LFCIAARSALQACPSGFTKSFSENKASEIALVVSSSTTRKETYLSDPTYEEQDSARAKHVKTWAVLEKPQIIAGLQLFVKKEFLAPSLVPHKLDRLSIVRCFLAILEESATFFLPFSLVFAVCPFIFYLYFLSIKIFSYSRGLLTPSRFDYLLLWGAADSDSGD
jgi:hypothetical protein